MKNIIISLGLLLVINSSLYGWEINTHRAIDHWAMHRYNGSKNLHFFIENIGLEGETYKNQIFEGYTLNNGKRNISYFDYATKGETKIGISTWKQSFSKYDYQDLIEVGTILEDSLWAGVTENIDTSYLNYADSAAGRFNFHFYDAYNHKGLSNIPGTKNTNKNHYANSSALNWVFNNTELYLFNPFNYGAESHKNNYNYDSALKYFVQGFTEGKQADRKKYRAKMLVSLGFMLHMVNDMSVPAHVRNDAHAPDDFEKWMREGDKNGNGGFRFTGSSLDLKSSFELIKLIRSISATKYTTKYDFMNKAADFSGKNFYSEDSIDLTGTYQLEGDITIPKEMSDKYITSKYGRLAKRTYKVVPAGLMSTVVPMDIIDDNVIQDNAKIIIPRAIANAEGFLNYFFRGRLKATLRDGNLTIENISDPSLVASADIVRFSGGDFSIYYENDKNITKPLAVNCNEFKSINNLEVNNTVSCNISDALNAIQDMGKEEKITIIYDGKIGNERGIAVAIAKKLANADVLFSFDKSGSMGSDIENAKNSAKEILDEVIGVDNNSTYIEIEAFNDSAGVLLAYENNVTKAKNAISTLYSGGGTALYDAIKLAGDNAVAHKNSTGIGKSIVILYTDGLENSSYATRKQAIDAISNAKAPEIDEVFLIHVGSGDGASELESIASEAGRKYLKVDDATALKDAIERILKGQ